MTAVRSAPRSEPAKRRDFRPRAKPRRARSAALFVRQTLPSSRKQTKRSQRRSITEQIGDRLRGVGADQPIVVPVADAHMLQAIEIAQKRLPFRSAPARSLLVAAPVADAIPASRATADTLAPASSDAATSRLLLLRRTPAPSLLNRCDDLDTPVPHVIIPMNSHMTHTLSSLQGGRYRTDTEYQTQLGLKTQLSKCATPTKISSDPRP